MHSIYFWPSVEDGLRELHGVLGPDGVVVVAVRMRREAAGLFDPSRYGCTDDQIASLVAALGSVGFRDSTTRRREIGRETIAPVMAGREHGHD